MSGSASAVSVGSGTVMEINATTINSTATNAITGAGACNTSGVTYETGTTYLNNVTTQSGGTIQGIRAGNAPSAGYLGRAD